MRKIAGVALSLRSGLRRPVRDFFRKIFGAAPGGVRGGRGQTRQRLRQTRTIHGASSFRFHLVPWTGGTALHAPAQRTDVPRAVAPRAGVPCCLLAAHRLKLEIIKCEIRTCEIQSAKALRSVFFCRVSFSFFSLFS